MTAKPIKFNQKFSFLYIYQHIIMNSYSGFCPVLSRTTDLSRLRPLRDALVEEAEFLDIGVGISPFSEAGLRPSFMDTGRGPGPGPGWTGSWITHNHPCLYVHLSNRPVFHIHLLIPRHPPKGLSLASVSVCLSCQPNAAALEQRYSLSG